MSAERSDFDEEFESAVEGWKNRYKLREDDAVFLLIELFRIHQRHWDELRRRDVSSMDEIPPDILKCLEDAKAIQNEVPALLKAIQDTKASGDNGISAATAFMAGLCALVAGYIIGRWFS